MAMHTMMKHAMQEDEALAASAANATAGQRTRRHVRGRLAASGNMMITEARVRPVKLACTLTGMAL